LYGCDYCEAALNHELALRGIGFGAELPEVGAGDKHARLAAFEDQAFQILAVGKLFHEGLELGDDRVAERIGAAAGLIKRDDTDGPVQNLKTEGGSCRLLGSMC